MSSDLPITEHVVIPASDLTWQFSRAGGPGGQHVNTAETRAQLRFALSTTSAIPGPVRARLRAANPQWCVDGGDLLIASSVHRSRHRNIEDCRDRLAEAVRAALVRPRKRRPTKRTRSSHERRLKQKKQRAQVKEGRGRYRD